MSDHFENPLEVAIVGGGVAGLETAIALRALAGPRVSVRVVEPEREFVYRPMAVAEPFAAGEARRYPLGQIADDLGIQLVADTVERVVPQHRRAFLGSGAELPYDELVIALGAEPRPAWDHVVTFGGPRDVEAMRTLVAEVERGDAESVAFVVPAGTSWPLPLYELALLTAERARSAGRAPELAIFTPERDPLAVVGRAGSALVARDLEAADIRVARSNAVEVTRDGEILIPFEEWPLRYERVVAVPRLVGRSPGGVPRDEHGFIPVDAHGAVDGADHLYAAGDCTSHPVKHGGLASQQADAVAELIAQRAGAAIEPRPFRGVLRAQLLGGTRARFLHADTPQQAGSISRGSETPSWWPVAKIASTYLAPYLAARDALPGAAFEPGDAHRRPAVVPDYFENAPWGE